MTIPLARLRSSHPTWVFPLISIAFAGLLLVPHSRTAYLFGLTLITAAAASFPAIEDYRTGLLRNKWTGPLATTGLLQVLISGAETPPWIVTIALCLAAAAITTSLYLLLGLLGWVGFGDVKFAAGLALLTACAAGWMSLYLLPLALVLSAASHLFRSHSRSHRRVQSPHGPALAAAAAILMIATCASSL